MNERKCLRRIRESYKRINRDFHMKEVGVDDFKKRQIGNVVYRIAKGKVVGMYRIA